MNAQDEKGGMTVMDLMTDDYTSYIAEGERAAEALYNPSETGFLAGYTKSEIAKASAFIKLVLHEFVRAKPKPLEPQRVDFDFIKYVIGIESEEVDRISDVASAIIGSLRVSINMD